LVGRYYDQWKVGDRIEHAHNPQPLHVDADFAAKSEFGRILVNGTFTFSLLVGLSVADIKRSPA